MAISTAVSEFCKLGAALVRDMIYYSGNSEMMRSCFNCLQQLTWQFQEMLFRPFEGDAVQTHIKSRTVDPIKYCTRWRIK
jgi:hypothetical protein